MMITIKRVERTNLNNADNNNNGNDTMRMTQVEDKENTISRTRIIHDYSSCIQIIVNQSKKSQATNFFKLTFERPRS